MAFRNVATLIAEGVALDSVTGRLTAFNMLEAVLAPTYPALLGKLAVVNLYEVDGERSPHWERVSILSDDGEKLAEVVAELGGEGVNHRSMGVFQGLRLSRPGVYTILVESANDANGPWERANVRHLRAEMGAYPLARGDGASAKTAGVSALTD